MKIFLTTPKSTQVSSYFFKASTIMIEVSVLKKLGEKLAFIFRGVVFTKEQLVALVFVR